MQQQQEIEEFRREEQLRIPEDFNYDSVLQLSNEEREKLKVRVILYLGNVSI